jgi:hypothetical protein
MKQTSVHQQAFVSSELSEESFKVVWKSKRAWFFRRKRAPISKQSDCHAGANGWYFERLLAWEVSLKDNRVKCLSEILDIVEKYHAMPQWKYKITSLPESTGQEELHPVTEALLNNRGYTTKEARELFLSPNFDRDIHDPSLC